MICLGHTGPVLKHLSDLVLFLDRFDGAVDDFIYNVLGDDSNPINISEDIVS